VTVRQIRQILNALAALCAVGIGCVLLWAIAGTKLPEPETPRIRQPMQTGGQSDGSNVTAEQLAAVWDSRLQRSPGREKREPQKTQPPAPRIKRSPAEFNPRVELLATIIDSAKTMAIISDARGQTDIKGVGETLQLLPSGLKIEEIEAGRVMLSHRGRTVELQLKGGTGGLGRGSSTDRGRFDNARSGRRNEQPGTQSESDHVKQGLGPDMSLESDPGSGATGMGGRN
jgi:hypothetical protein